jgi:hypothetical protein
MAQTAIQDDACPFEWAEFNLPQELRPASKSVSPLARRVLNAGATQRTAGAAWAAGDPSRTESGFGSLLLPRFGLPLPKL